MAVRESPLNITKYCPVSWDLIGTTEENCRQLIRNVFEEASNSRINLWDAYVHAWDSAFKSNDEEWFKQEEVEVNGKKIKHEEMNQLDREFKEKYELRFKAECKGNIFNLLRLLSKVRAWRTRFVAELIRECKGIKEQNSQIKIPVGKRQLAIDLANKSLEEFKAIKQQYDMWGVFNRSKPDIYIRQFDVSDAYTKQEEEKRTKDRLIEQVKEIRQSIEKRLSEGKEVKGKRYIRKLEKIRELLGEWNAEGEPTIIEELNIAEGMISE